MLNIYICGFGREAFAVKKQIDTVLKKIGLQNDAITSTIELEAESCDGKYTDKPFLRVDDNEKSTIDRIIKAFKDNSLKFDTRWNVTGGFIPAEDMVPDSPKHSCEMCGSIEHMQSLTGKCPGDFINKEGCGMKNLRRGYAPYRENPNLLCVSNSKRII